MTEIILSVIGGLVLFLFAVFSLSDAILSVVGDNVKKWIARFTSNIFSGIITGTVITAIVDSSSAVIIITIILVNSKALTFKQAMGIVMGANIGTTISSQIIAMDVSKYSPVLLLIGFLLLFISKSVRLNSVGKVILYFGVLFFGLFTMEKAVEPLREEAYFAEWLKSVESPVFGALMGALITLVVQSSSATMGMAIILAKKGLLSLSGGIAIMLGAELGTCSDTLLATINGSRQALKTGLFHLLFNILSIILGLLLFYPFTELVEKTGSGEHVEHLVANAHMMFNIGGVLLFVWFVPLFEKLLNKMLPEKKVAQ
ncbi:Na/Pi cotransporter family protein [Flavobacterium salilacus subsp. salilacus]|uniref:Na/Pi cotransporter family protein n=1 Tax=Flavobacterium TaxID=237 RepID=UPI001074E653|nr:MULTISPECIES: Na/Pi symporter [Flavobacterium]KAF2519914.1 Na/Pi cotransporter family protein [Flavobacterium salilacus subsp. salilacus]MBE1614176.1 Na/Pi cotransporter family protein [Flavobacterium sp. SaA2.13]